MTRTEDWADYLDPAEPDPDLPASQREPLDRVTSALAREELWDTPPPGLRDAVLARAAEDAASPDQAPGDDDRPAVTPLRPVTRRTGQSGRTRRTWIVAAAGLAAAAALVAVLAWPRQQPQTTFAMTGTALAPRASAVAELDPRSAGIAIRLQITGLAPAPPGAYYAAWLRGPTGSVPVGSFHWHKGGIPIDLWSGVGSDRYPELIVTLQHEGQPPAPSADIVLSGHAAG